MRKKLLLLLTTTILSLMLFACNSEDTKNITENSATSSSSKTTSGQTLSGYILKAEGAAGTISITPDMDASEIVEALGKPVSYFEAASCAFQGMDKIYTYPHFELHTYPQGEVDKIAMIVFLDDLISTSEGVRIGMGFADMEKAYGSSYEITGDAFSYTKDDMLLTFIITDGVIQSIEYASQASN